MKNESIALPGKLWAPVDKAARDYLTEKPVNNDGFKVIRSLYTYDRTDLKASTSKRVQRSDGLAAEQVSFAAEYGEERVIARLYLPKDVEPPYQTVLYVPPRSAIFLSEIDDYEAKFIEFLVKTGRAVLLPVCQGMYGRRKMVHSSLAVPETV